MSCDVTYHPFNSSEMRSLYFANLDDPWAYLRLGRQFNLEPPVIDALGRALTRAGQLPADVPFHEGHGHCLAILAGFVRKYWYLHGRAFSHVLSAHPEFRRYVTHWRSLLPPAHAESVHSDGILHNGRCGVFMGEDQLRQLSADYITRTETRAVLNETFQHNLPVFWQAVDFAIENGFGLIEAAGLVCPHPFDPDDTKSMLPLGHCELDGVRLYINAATGQRRQGE